MNHQPDCSASRAEASAAGRFPRRNKLLRHADFQRVYQQGRRHFAPHMTVFELERESAEPPGVLVFGPRIGLTVGRALGGAVERNRIKRRLREAVRANLKRLIRDVDVVINPKKSALTVEFAALREEVARAFEKIGSSGGGRQTSEKSSLVARRAGQAQEEKE